MRVIELTLIYEGAGQLMLRRRHKGEVEVGDWVSAPVFSDEDTHCVIAEKAGRALLRTLSFHCGRRPDPTSMRAHLAELKQRGWHVIAFDGFWRNPLYGLPTSDRIKVWLRRFMS